MGGCRDSKVVAKSWCMKSQPVHVMKTWLSQIWKLTDMPITGKNESILIYFNLKIVIVNA